ncbi:MAG: hypothetical protein JWO86_2933 [Myxococcaceae bacterium]|jgi:hypothetical protein|nr:hypothetical protein [Myxococcaceae bacterium]
MLLDWLTQRVFDRAHRDHDGAPFEIAPSAGRPVNVREQPALA